MRVNLIHIAAAALLALAAPLAIALNDVDADAPTPGPAPIPDDQTLERLGAVIGKVEIVRLDVFDPNQPGEDKAVYRLANRVHIDSRERLIRSQLLFRPGQRYERRLLDETERALRQNKYIYDADIRVESFENGSVDLTVLTQDVWTLTASVSASRSGGANTGSLHLKELNLLGTGIGVELARADDVDRTSTSLSVVDNHIAGSRFGAYGRYASNSDGATRELGFGLPFYALDARHAGSFSLLDDDRVDPIYDLGEVIDEYRHRERSAQLFLGRSAGLQGSWVTRYLGGIAFEEHTFQTLADTTGIAGLPGDRRFAYPFIGVEILENRYEETTNLHQIQRPEDVFMGTRFAARLGYSSAALGGDGSAWLGELSIRSSWGNADATSLELRGGFNGRLEDGDVIGLLGGGATLNWRQSERRALQVRVEADLGHARHLDQYLVVGGDTGLRGYPLRYQRGEGRALVTVEQRFFTDWQPLRLFSVGAVAFADAGRVWSGDLPGATDAGFLSDVGVGLRLGNRRSGSARMIHIDLAMPLNGPSTLDRLQLLIGSEKRF